MRKPKLTALALLFLTGTVVLAAGSPPTDVSISSVTVGGPNQGIYTMVAQGAMSLAASDTLNSYTFAFNGPSGQLAPNFNPPFTPPKPGSSSNYTCNQSTAVKGAWNFTASMTYTTAAGSGTQVKTISAMQSYNVG